MEHLSLEEGWDYDPIPRIASLCDSKTFSVEDTCISTCGFYAARCLVLLSKEDFVTLEHLVPSASSSDAEQRFSQFLHQCISSAIDTKQH